MAEFITFVKSIIGLKIALGVPCTAPVQNILGLSLDSEVPAQFQRLVSQGVRNSNECPIGAVLDVHHALGMLGTFLTAVIFWRAA